MNKKIILKRILLVVSIFILIFFLDDFSKSEASSNLMFIRITDGYEIHNIRDRKDKTPIVIPEFYNGLPVTAIGTSAFQDSEAISITIEKPENIRFIELDAFKNTKAINPISLPNITNVPSMAFHNSNFSEIHLSDKVERIGPNAFSEARATNSIDLIGVKYISLRAFFDSNFSFINLNWDNISYVGLNAFNKEPKINLSQDGNNLNQTEINKIHKDLNILIDVDTQVELNKLEYQWTTKGVLSERNWILTKNNTIVSPVNNGYEGDYYLHVRATPIKKSSLNTTSIRTSKFLFDNIPANKPIMNVSTKELTNKDVIISTIFSSDSTIKEYKMGENEWIKYNGDLIIKENTTVYTRSFDGAGNVSETSSIVINNIDKTAPTKPIIKVSTTKITNQNVIVENIYSNDSFIREYRVGTGEWVKYTDDLTITENTVIYARAFDEAGNMSETILMINNIDKIAPNKPIINLKVEELKDKKKTKVITTVVDYSPDSLIKEIKIGLNEWIRYKGPIKIMENTIIYVRGIDSAGNISEIETKVIDEIHYDEIEEVYIDFYEDGANVSIEFPKSSIENEYHLGNGEWLNYDSLINVKEDTIIYIKKTDKDKNVTYSEHEIIINPNKQNENATLRLNEGEFTLRTSDIDSFGKLKLKAKKQTITTGFTNDFGVIDARGTQEGWSLMVSATPFTIETFDGFIGIPHQLPIGSLALNVPTTVEQVGRVNNSQLPDIIANDFLVIDGENKAIKILEAVKYKGMGEFSIKFEKNALSLTIDAVTAKIDKVNYPNQNTPYSSTITWDLINSP